MRYLLKRILIISVLISFVVGCSEDETAYYKFLDARGGFWDKSVMNLEEKEYPFGQKDVQNFPNTSIYNYKVDSSINSKADFIAFLKNNQPKYELGSFMDKDKNVNWETVSDSIIINKAFERTIYSLEYKTLDPECNFYMLDITNDGYVRDYRSAGE